MCKAAPSAGQTGSRHLKQLVFKLKWDFFFVKTDCVMYLQPWIHPLYVHSSRGEQSQNAFYFPQRGFLGYKRLPHAQMLTCWFSNHMRISKTTAARWKQLERWWNPEEGDFPVIQTQIAKLLLNNGGKPVSQTFGNVSKMLVCSQATGLAGGRAGVKRDLSRACLSYANAATFSVK